MINVRIQTPKETQLSPKIAVLGVGGAGGNAVNNMIQSNLEGCDFIVCNTDAQALEGSMSENKMQLGTHVTGGLGAGANPDVGRQAAEESLEEVLAHLEGANMAFITAGMGGGTGTGAAPVIAKAARDAGILTVGVVTKPFHFEGTHRMKMAEAGIEEMQAYVDTLIVIPNQNLFRVANEKTTFAEAFKMADSVLQSGVRGVTDLMVNPGIINLDFADIRSAMMEMGKAMMGTGEATGERRAIEAAEAAINNPLLDDVSMKGARGVIINVTGGEDISLFEVDEACNRIRDEVDPNANIIFGTSLDDRLEGTMRVSVVATGIDVEQMQKTKPTSGGIKVTSISSRKIPDVPEKPSTARSMPNTTGMRTQPQMPVRNLGGASPAPQPQASMTMPSPAPATRARAAASQVIASMNTMSATAQKIQEPEVDMFEQSEFLQGAQTTVRTQTGAASGYVQQGQFIPPAPVVPERQTPVMHTSGFGPVSGSKPDAQGAQQTDNPMQAPFVASAPAVQATTRQESPLVLRPPVPGQGATERKQSPSLFERITGVGRDMSAKRQAAQAEAAQHASPSPRSSGLSASTQADKPSQGSLNIDSPSAPKRSEDELDIPAFLRRQAN